jgi:uncharacterized lipoprotein YddW (UPF0748 family)
MNRKLLFLLLPLIWAFSATAQTPPKRELRGAWISSYFGLDWPNKNESPATQRSRLITILDHHKATGINVVYLQVRSQSDALYPSAIEPWSNDLTGIQGVAPNPVWDPLQFAIEETHKRGMELHAWINPYRAVGNTATPAASHVSNTHPEWMMRSGASGTTILKILNPALPAVRDHIVNVIQDLVTRYDIDGIHFDDYFYPTTIVQSDDDAMYNSDRRGFTNKGDWRRDNVNLLIKRVNETIYTLKPWVKFGVSPSGIYRNSKDPAIGTDTRGLEHYTSLYADTRRWLQEGWVDYIAPQVYWNIGFYPTADYQVIVPWWNNNAYGRHIYIGMASYRVNENAAWRNPSEIPNQVRLNRSYPNVYGSIYFRTQHLRANLLGHRDSLRLNLYKKPALLPTMPWKDSTPPAAPSALEANRQLPNTYVLTWNGPAATTHELDRVWQYAIYRSESPVIDITDANNLLAITNTAIYAYTDATAEAGKTYYYTVTALDRFHNESIPSNVTDYAPPTITCPDNQTVQVDAACTVTVPDYRSLAIVSDDVTPVNQLTITQTPAAGTILTGTGTHNITLTATDAAGKSASCSFTVTAADTIAPTISAISADPAVLLSPNHKMRDITVLYTLNDNCGTATSTLSVSSNEPGNGKGDGNKEPDYKVIDAHHVQLRAERLGNGDGRIYTITITATDAAGNVSKQDVVVTVPHDQAPITARTKAIQEEEQPVNSLTITATPNPTADQFVIQTRSNKADVITVVVTNADGKVIEVKHGIAANGQLRIGQAYRPGTYFIEVRQGKEKQTLTLIKQ